MCEFIGILGIFIEVVLEFRGVTVHLERFLLGELHEIMSGFYFTLKNICTFFYDIVHPKMKKKHTHRKIF